MPCLHLVDLGPGILAFQQPQDSFSGRSQRRVSTLLQELARAYDEALPSGLESRSVQPPLLIADPAEEHHCASEAPSRSGTRDLSDHGPVWTSTQY